MVQHEHIDLPEVVGDLAHDVPRVLLVGHVAAQGQAAPSLPLDQFLRTPRVGVLLQIGDRHVRPSWGNPTATARPIPESPPVTRARLPASNPRPV
jgi:hypothetical protein